MEGNEKALPQRLMGRKWGASGPYGRPDGVPEGRFVEEFCLSDYPWDTVDLHMAFSHFTAFADPIEIVVK